MRRTRLLIPVLLVAGPLWAVPRATLQSAESLLAEGNVEEALQIYQDLQVEYPEAPEALLGVGCTHYRQAEMQLAAGQLEEARASFAEAEESFQRLFSAETDAVRASAMFNYANALAKTAKSYDREKEYNEQVETLRRAEGAYQELLNTYPGHAEAQSNLDHVRFVLKNLLQHQPEQQKQPPPVFRLQATTELPDKEAVVEENQVILQEKPADAAPPQAPATAEPPAEEISL